MAVKYLTRTVSVRTVDGMTTEHSYRFPDDPLYSNVGNVIGSAMKRPKRLLVLTNPFVAYRVEHIVAITFDWENEEDAREDKERTLGFLQDR